MTTLKKLSYQGMRLLSGGTKPRDSKLSDQYIQEEIKQITAKLIRTEWFGLKNAGENAVSPYCIATYPNLAVQSDATSGRNYIDLPAQPMNIPGGEGIQQVKPQTGEPDIDRAMVLIKPNEFEMFRSLLVGAEIMKDQFCAEPDRSKIWFTEINDETLLDQDITDVELKMVVIDPSQVGENDAYPIPPEMEIDILKELLVLHGYNPQQAHDMINDGK